MKKTIPLDSRPSWLGQAETGEAGALVLVLALGLASACLAAEHTWRQKADMPTARIIHSTCAVNGKIYAIGGTTSEPNPEAVQAVEVYDPTTDSWTQKADIPTPRALLSTSVVNGKIYAIGGGLVYGGPGVSTVEEYDPATNTWMSKADMPTPRWGLSTSVLNGKIYAIGGRPKKEMAPVSTVEEYDPTTDTWTWTRKADMPLGVSLHNACVVRGKIYALGGRPEATGGMPYVQEYDPATDTWTRKADMLVGTSQMASAVLGDKIIVVGGWQLSNESPYTAVQMYDPEADIWTREPDAPFLRAGFSASVVNNRMYVIGGTDRPHPCPATSTVYELTVGSPPDFNGDFKIDIEDLIILIEYWGQNEPLCDIGPMPFGDGIVDVQDLEVLMSYWQQEVEDPTLIAHWALDEIEGSFAADSAGNNDASVFGPVWQPNGGMVAGALQFDGIDDYVTTDFVLNPADGEFSVFAWVKGGAPGQVIISQTQGGVNWLLADPADGKLMTELKSSGRSGSPLWSQTVITDGNWHRIGFVWDGSQRILYVDDVEVATDKQDSLEGSTGGLYIGAGNALEAGSFFSGLIDDVRIYNRAVTP